MREVDSDTITRLMIEHQGLICALGRRYAHEFDADERHTFALEAVWRSARRFDPERGSYTTLLHLCYRSVVNQERKRRNAKKYRLILLEMIADPIQPIADDCFRQIDQRDELRHILASLLKRLSDNERDAFLLVYGSGFTYAEAADRLHWTAKGVDLAIGRVKRKIRDKGRGVVRRGIRREGR